MFHAHAMVFAKGTCFCAKPSVFTKAQLVLRVSSLLGHCKLFHHRKLFHNRKLFHDRKFAA